MNEVNEIAKTANTMNWPGAFAILFGLIGVALIFHGFPNIRIGGTDVNHYHKEEDEYDEE